MGSVAEWIDQGVARKHSSVSSSENNQRAVDKRFAKPVEPFANYDENRGERVIKSAMKTAMKSALNRRSYKG